MSSPLQNNTNASSNQERNDDMDERYGKPSQTGSNSLTPDEKSISKNSESQKRSEIN
jgi:hypothetical protein